MIKSLLKEGVILLANRLKILLAERDLTIKDLMKATGLSRNSLSNMVNNPFANIATDNVDKLCNYLEVAPKDFYDYSGWRFDFQLLKSESSKSGVSGLAILMTSGKLEVTINLDVDVITSIEKIESLGIRKCDVYIVINCKNNLDKRLIDVYTNSLSPLFQHQIENKFNLMVSEITDTAESKGMFKNIKKPVLNILYAYLSNNELNFSSRFTYHRNKPKGRRLMFGNEVIETLK